MKISATLSSIPRTGNFIVVSQGEPEGAKDARKTVINALIGVVIVTLASTIVAFIARSF